MILSITEGTGVVSQARHGVEAVGEPSRCAYAPPNRRYRDNRSFTLGPFAPKGNCTSPRIFFTFSSPKSSTHSRTYASSLSGRRG